MMVSQMCDYIQKLQEVIQMVDTRLLRDKIEEKKMNISEIALKMGIDKATLYRRIANSETFTIGEVGKITAILKLSHDEAVSIFFSNSVA